MFKRIIFWSEFPSTVNWQKIKRLIDFKTEIYVAVRTKKQYLFWKKKIQSKNIKVGAWPVLSKKEGYWFSGFTSKKGIDKLKEFKGIDIKVDIEPPMPKGNYSKLQLFTWLLPYFLKKGKNNDYLKTTIEDLGKNTKIIASGFPFPQFWLKRIGDDITIKGNIKKNYIFYSTFSPFLNHFWYKNFAKTQIKKYGDKVMFALGLIGKGIFKTEPIYKNVKEFEKDLTKAEKLGIKNIVIYRIGAILERESPEEWIKVIKKFI